MKGITYTIKFYILTEKGVFYMDNFTFYEPTYSASGKDSENIILDVDGTLWDTTDIVAGSWSRAIQDVGIEGVSVTADDLKRLFGKTMKVIARAILPDCSDEKRDEVMEACCRYEEEDLRNSPCKVLYPEVKQTIIELSKTRKVFIVSNCQAGYIELFLEKTNLSEYVSDIECYGNTGKQKGENIQILMKRNGIHKAVYVGDTIGDCEAAAQAGIPFVFAEYGFGDVPGNPLNIKKFDELLKLDMMLS